MAQIEIRQLFRVPPARVWEAITQPALYLELGLVQSIRRIDGIEGGCWDEGARREIKMSGWRFVELVKNVRANETMEIEVLENSSPIDQQYERIDLAPAPEGCEVTWTFRLTMKRPWLRRLDPIVAALFKASYRRVLKKAKARIEALA
jgi:hypothetical protein